MVTFLSYVGVALVCFVLGKWVSHRRQVAAAFAAGGAAHAKSVALAQGGSVIFNGYPVDHGAGAIEHDDSRRYDDIEHDRTLRIVHDEFDRLRREHVSGVLPVGRIRRPDGVPSGSARDADSDNGCGVGVPGSPVVERINGMMICPPDQVERA